MIKKSRKNKRNKRINGKFNDIGYKWIYEKGKYLSLKLTQWNLYKLLYEKGAVKIYAQYKNEHIKNQTTIEKSHIKIYLINYNYIL